MNTSAIITKMMVKSSNLPESPRAKPGWVALSGLATGGLFESGAIFKSFSRSDYTYPNMAMSGPESRQISVRRMEEPGKEDFPGRFAQQICQPNFRSKPITERMMGLRANGA